MRPRGERLLARLKTMDNPLVRDLRGRGLLIGVEIDTPGGNGLMTGTRARAALANAEDRTPTRILSSQGPLADHVEGFSARSEQQEMA
ncbi:MAG: hypothetical protein M3461_01915, partial [Pseudomonadota bacterium]|nr:hypothetical protein [Pseudomonadota bacterium]